MAYAATEPQPHWHFVTCGLSASRFIPGYPAVGDRELTFRLGRLPDEKAPPAWVAPFLQQLGRDAFSSDDALEVGGTCNLEVFWQQEHDTALTAGHYIEDPLVPKGSIQLVQLVALTVDERNKVATLSTGRTELVLELAAAGISDLGRAPRAVPAPPRPSPTSPLPGREADAGGLRGGGSSRVRRDYEGEHPRALHHHQQGVDGSHRHRGHRPQRHLGDDTRDLLHAAALEAGGGRVGGSAARHGQALRYDALPDLELFVECAAPKKEAPPKESVLKKLGNFFGLP